jgi:hypothetical protein
MRADTPRRRIALLGPFPVSAAADSVRQFSDSLCVDGSRPLPARTPLTYPIRWFALPEIRNEIERSLSMLPGLPVQESQTFDYAREIEVGCDYRLTVEVHVEAGEQQRIRLRGVAYDVSDNRVVTMEAMLRLLAAATPGGRQR